jgi:hypothetical protein
MKKALRFPAGFSMRRLPTANVRWIVALVMTLGSRPLFAQGGPPLLTDDPDTPGPGHWEINFSFLRERTRHTRLSETPRLDVNYGVGRRIQLKVEMPYLSRKEDGGPAATGVGSTVAGVKWRFLGQEGQKIAWSVYPQYEFNLADASVAKGLVEYGHVLLLPTELTLEVRPIELNIEVGRTFSSRRADEWVYGLATEASIAHRVELLGELHGEKADRATELIVNGGARVQVTAQLTAMLAIGHAVHGSPEERPRLLVYAGLQFNVPDRFDFSTPKRPRNPRPGSAAGH